MVFLVEQGFAAHSGEFGTGFRSKPAGGSSANRQVIPFQTGTASHSKPAGDSAANRQAIPLQSGTRLRSKPAGFLRADGYATELAPTDWEILA
jgi:hypothetical protein